MTTDELTQLPHTTKEEGEHHISVSTEEGYLFHTSHTTKDTDPTTGEETERTTHDYATSIAAPKGCTTLAEWEVVPEAERIENEPEPESPTL